MTPLGRKTAIPKGPDALAGVLRLEAGQTSLLPRPPVARLPVSYRPFAAKPKQAALGLQVAAVAPCLGRPVRLRPRLSFLTSRHALMPLLQVPAAVKTLGQFALFLRRKAVIKVVPLPFTRPTRP